MTLYTSAGIAFQIDDDDYPEVSKYKWCLGGDYVGNAKLGLLHEFLGGKAPAGLYWDHRNRDKLDNRRQNLRLVTPTISARNLGIRIDNTSGYKGVSPVSSGWLARITVYGRIVHLGIFKRIEDAAEARRKGEDLYWGENR